MTVPVRPRPAAQCTVTPSPAASLRLMNAMAASIWSSDGAAKSWDRVVLGCYAERVEFVLVNGPLVQRHQGTHAGCVKGT